MEKIIYSSRIKTFCWALFFLAIIYGNFLMLNDNNITDTFFRLTLVLGMLLSCCIFLLFLYLTIIRTPMCIINESGIKCINFQDNHKIKQLKNDASIRIVPIPKQLLDIGFVDWVNKQKKKLNATDTDFIFPKCKTKSGEYNNKYSTRGFIQYIKDIGITKSNPNKRLDFHSLRKNASNRLDTLGVPCTYINGIIGWEGDGTREKYYSQHNLQEIKKYTDKMNYDFLNNEFDYWSNVMKDL